MVDRELLIVRKQEVRRRIEQLRRTLEGERTKETQSQWQIDRLERRVEQLMAEEYSLRVAIDQAH